MVRHCLLQLQDCLRHLGLLSLSVVALLLQSLSRLVPIANALIQNSQHLLAVVASVENSCELADGYLDVADPIEGKSLEV